MHRLPTRGLSLGPELVARHRSIGALAAAVDREDSSVMSFAELRHAAEPTPALRNAICVARAQPHPDAPPRHILMTGATGFLRSRLVCELRARTDARLTCLVRDPKRLDPVDGCEVVVGDITRSRLGLSETDWSRLRDQADAVVHCAAVVSLARSYEELEAANVDGTREALRLACEGRPASFHYASTLSVFVSTDRDEGVAREDDDLAATHEVYGGYAQSKVAAELAVRHAEGALPISLYRLGLLTGDRRDASAPRNDWLTLLVRGLVRLGAVPKDVDEDLAFDVTPVDHAAGAMASLIASKPEKGLRTFHIAAATSTRLVDLVRAIRGEGVQLEPVSSESFLELLRAGDLVDAATLLALTRTIAPSRERRALDMFQATRMRFDERAARAAGIVAPSPDPELLRRYVRRMLATQ